MPIDQKATRDALARIARDGSDLSRPLKIDFFVAVPDEASGHAVARLAAPAGFAVNVEQDAVTEGWTCYCTKTLVPTHEAVIAIEEQLERIARDVGGFADGFGTFGNADDPRA